MNCWKLNKEEKQEKLNEENFLENYVYYLRIENNNLTFPLVMKIVLMHFKMLRLMQSRSHFASFILKVISDRKIVRRKMLKVENDL